MVNNFEQFERKLKKELEQKAKKMAVDFERDLNRIGARHQGGDKSTIKREVERLIRKREMKPDRGEVDRYVDCLHSGETIEVNLKITY